MPTRSPATDQALADFGAAVKRSREQKDMGVQEFADQLGITRRHLFNVESGRRRASNRLYHRIADALGIDASSVLGES